MTYGGRDVWLLCDIWAIDAGSESGHPGSPHYDDQLNEWLTARYHYLPLNHDKVATSTVRELILTKCTSDL